MDVGSEDAHEPGSDNSGEDRVVTIFSILRLSYCLHRWRAATPLKI